MGNDTCRTCGAVIGDARTHRNWHDEADRKVKDAIDRALRDVAREANLLAR